MTTFAENYLEVFKNQIDSQAITRLKEAKFKQLQSEKNFAVYRESVDALPSFKTSFCDVQGPVVTIGKAEEFSEAEARQYRQALEVFMPWKKGPFCLFGHEIDAEWRSDLKWERIRAHMPSLEGKVVADIGCHNGYFMFRMAAHDPSLVIGFEPIGKHWYNFQLMQRFAQLPNLAFELLGVEDIHLYTQFFDSIFCLGILYHHRDPIGLLQKIFTALKPGGSLIIDCQGIAGEEPYALFPAGRYAQARGMWFLPTLSCLINWLQRAQFKAIEPFYQAPLSSEEQRSSSWAPIKSLQDFLDPSDKSKTIEGYPAPWRFYVSAKK